MTAPLSWIGAISLALAFGSYIGPARKWYTNKSQASPGKRSKFLYQLKEQSSEFKKFTNSINPNFNDLDNLFFGFIFPYFGIFLIGVAFLYLPYWTYVGNVLTYFSIYLYGAPVITFVIFLLIRGIIPNYFEKYKLNENMKVVYIIYRQIPKYFLAYSFVISGLILYSFFSEILILRNYSAIVSYLEVYAPFLAFYLALWYTLELTSPYADNILFTQHFNGMPIKIVVSPVSIERNEPKEQKGILTGIGKTLDLTYKDDVDEFTKSYEWRRIAEIAVLSSVRKSK